MRRSGVLVMFTAGRRISRADSAVRDFIRNRPFSVWIESTSIPKGGEHLGIEGKKPDK